MNNKQSPQLDNSGIWAEGHIKIFDPDSQEVYVDKRNAIHFENFSEALALCLSNKSTGFIHELHLGNGGTSVDPTGVITYLPPNTNGSTTDLYNRTYYKVVDSTSAYNSDTTRNNMSVRHIPGKYYSDILVTTTLEYGEPSDQLVFDNTANLDSVYVFDELGLKSWGGSLDSGKLLTHVIFHPVQKSLNRMIQIDYTIRIQSLTNLTSQV